MEKAFKKYEKQDYMKFIAEAIESIVNDDCLVIFFGSILNKRFNKTSDIDVAIFCKNGLPSNKYLRILDKLEKLPILRKIDFVNLHNVKDTELAKEIIKGGKIWKNMPELLKDLEKHLENLER